MKDINLFKIQRERMPMMCKKSPHFPSCFLDSEEYCKVMTRDPGDIKIKWENVKNQQEMLKQYSEIKTLHSRQWIMYSTSKQTGTRHRTAVHYCQPTGYLRESHSTFQTQINESTFSELLDMKICVIQTSSRNSPAHSNVGMIAQMSQRRCTPAEREHCNDRDQRYKLAIVCF